MLSHEYFRDLLKLLCKVDQRRIKTSYQGMIRLFQDTQHNGQYLQRVPTFVPSSISLHLSFVSPSKFLPSTYIVFSIDLRLFFDRSSIV